AGLSSHRIQDAENLAVVAGGEDVAILCEPRLQLIRLVPEQASGGDIPDYRARATCRQLIASGRETQFREPMASRGVAHPARLARGGVDQSNCISEMVVLFGYADSTEMADRGNAAVRGQCQRKDRVLGQRPLRPPSGPCVGQRDSSVSSGGKRGPVRGER